MRRGFWWGVALGGLAVTLTTFSARSDARPDGVTPFLGTYETKGRYSNWRRTKADIAIERAPDGTLTITRTGRYTSWRHRRKPRFTWTSEDVRLDGDELKVVYRLTPDGRSVNLGEGGNLIDALEDEVLTTDDGTVVEEDALNVFEARYWFKNDKLREEVENTTRKDPEDWWRRLGTKGDKLSSPDPDTLVARVKLGGELEARDGRYRIVIPTDGELTVSVSAGTVQLEDPSGKALPIAAAASISHEIGHEAPALGTYVAIVSGAGDEGATLSAKFVQRGKIDPRIRPWSSHTYYPIYEFSYGDSENDDTLFRSGGPLEKFDRALQLTGKESAIWWERGGDYRTSFGFEHGHYTKVRSPSEEAAEAEWRADLDRDGVIADETPEELFARYDADEDGAVTEAEARAVLEQGVIDSLFARYDADGDGAVSGEEIFDSFITSHDADGTGDVSAEEWAAALRKDYASLLSSRTDSSLSAFMGKDEDGDGAIALAEVGTPGAIDFQDSSDVDSDYDSFFDRDNIKLVTKAGETHYGNEVVEEDGKLKLFKGRKSDELVVELDPADVETRKDGVADDDLDDSYSVGWWGHCNAWAMASIVFRKPAGDLTHEGVTFTVRDQKGLLVEFGMGDTEDSTFWWQQWGGDEIPPDRYTAGFHRQMHRWLRVEQKGMMADMDLKDPHNNLNFQVWNYPLIGYEAELTEAEGDDPYVLDVDCTLEKGSYSDEDSSSTASLSYRLHFADDGSIREGEGAKTDWTQTNSNDEREYVRYLMHPFRFLPSRDGSRNPNVTLDRLETLFGDALKYNRLEDLEAEEAAAAAAGGLSGTEPGATAEPADDDAGADTTAPATASGDDASGDDASGD